MGHAASQEGLHLASAWGRGLSHPNDRRASFKANLFLHRLREICGGSEGGRRRRRSQPFHDVLLLELLEEFRATMRLRGLSSYAGRQGV